MPLVLEENSSCILLQSGPACNGTDLLVRQYLSKQSAHLAENLNQVATADCEGWINENIGGGSIKVSFFFLNFCIGGKQGHRKQVTLFDQYKALG